MTKKHTNFDTIHADFLVDSHGEERAITPIATQAESEAGTETEPRIFSPLNIAQAISALGAATALEFGKLITTGGSGTQTPGTSFSVMNQWAANGSSSTNIAPDFSTNVITINATGFYLVAFQMSFVGSNSSVVNAALFWNGVEQSCGFQRKLGTGADVGSASAIGIIDVTATGNDLDLRVKCDGAGDSFGLVEGSLVLVRIAAT